MTIKKDILDKIENEGAKMKPKWHFLVKNILFFIGLLFFILISLYLSSFIFFVLSQNGSLFIPSFGLVGWKIFFQSLPWLLILLAIIFVVILETLIKKYSFAYRRPLVVSLGVVIILILISDVFISRLSLHNDISRLSDRRQVPVAGPLYRRYELQKIDNVHLGLVQELIENGFEMENRRSERLEVIFTPLTNFPYGRDFRVGDKVFVFGPREGRRVEAVGVRVIEGGARVQIK